MTEQSLMQEKMEGKVCCPRCGRYWEYKTEQAVSVDLFGGCVSCRKELATKEDLHQIMEEAGARGAYMNPGTLEQSRENASVELRCPWCHELVYKKARLWVARCSVCGNEWEDAS